MTPSEQDMERARRIVAAHLHHNDLDELQHGIARALSDTRRGGVYLSRTEVAERIGVTPGALSRYKLPEPDAWIGDVRGWLPATVDAWQAARPGRGARTDLRRHVTDYDPELDGPPHRFESSGTYDAGREVCAECGMDRAADEHRPPYTPAVST